VAPELAKTHTAVEPDLRGYVNVSGKPMNAGHNIQEDDPAGTLTEIRALPG